MILSLGNSRHDQKIHSRLLNVMGKAVVSVQSIAAPSSYLSPKNNDSFRVYLFLQDVECVKRLSASIRHNVSRVKVKKISRHRLKLALFYAIRTQLFHKAIDPETRLLYHTALCGNSSVGRAQPCQGWVASSSLVSRSKFFSVGKF